MNDPNSPQYSASSSQPSELRSNSVSPSSRFMSAPGRARMGSSSNGAYPVNFRQINGQALSNGFLFFEYVWESSTGFLPDLMGCTVGEKVTYPGGNPYYPPDPPFDHWDFQNPTILNEEGYKGYVPDLHQYLGFSTPYLPISFECTQIYRYHTPWMPPNEYVTLLGPLKIKRSIVKTNGLWYYKITKNNITATLQLPTGTTRHLNSITNIDDLLELLKTITVGISRKDLLKHFTPAGGIYSPPIEKFICKYHPNIKVNVEFSNGKTCPSQFGPDDQVVSLSQFFIDRQHSILD